MPTQRAEQELTPDGQGETQLEGGRRFNQESKESKVIVMKTKPQYLLLVLVMLAGVYRATACVRGGN